MVGVTGSIPVVPTIFFNDLGAPRLRPEEVVSTRSRLASSSGAHQLVCRCQTWFTPKEQPRAGNVVDLMEALRRGVGGEAAETKTPKKPAKKGRKAVARQKEMLMPIAGKKPAKEAAAKKSAARPQRKSA